MTDDADLVKAGTQGAVEGLLQPYASLISSLLGPAADEFGLMLRDHVRVFRARRMARLFQKTKEMVDGGQIDVLPIPLKLFLPIVDTASLEEDDELQDRWAALLINSSGSAMPAAPDILRQLTKEDVFLLQLCFDHVNVLDVEAFSNMSYLDTTGVYVNSVVEEWKHLIGPKFGHHYPGSFKWGVPGIWGLTLDNVCRLGLLNLGTGNEPQYFMTHLGYSFVHLCQDPSKRRKNRFELWTPAAVS
jgi:hypothetical protein